MRRLIGSRRLCVRAAVIYFVLSTICFAGNPFVWWDGNADPTIRVFNGTAYLYPSHDSSEYVTTWLYVFKRFGTEIRLS
jgi:hypothetical protein